MEFENNQPTDDEQQRLAVAKKVTIQPLHTDIMPDAVPDAEIAAQSKAQEVAPTATNDTEDTNTSHLIQPTKSALNKATNDAPSARSVRPATLTLAILFFIVLTGATIWLWMRAT